MTMTIDNYFCPECGEVPGTITVTKRDNNEHALHIRAKCLGCECVEDYYDYIA